MIRVLVVADSAILQSGLAAIVELSPELVVVGRENSLVAGLLPGSALTADVLLIAVELTETTLSDLELLEDSLLPSVWLVEPQDPLTLEAWRLGVPGLLPHDATATEIVSTIAAVAAGLIVLHPDIAMITRSTAARSALTPLSQSHQPLTDREIEVLQMLAEGMANKTIARQLHISEHTVKFHISSIFAKLQVSSRTEAVTIGIRQGLILL